MKYKIVYAGENSFDEDFPYKTFKVLEENKYVTSVYEFNDSFINLFTNKYFDSAEQAMDSAVSHLNR